MTPAGAGRFRRRRALLTLGVAAPLFAAGLIGAALLAWPEFDHARQYVSELGGADARRPGLFNGAVLLTGLSCIGVGVGFALAIVGLGGSRVAAGLTAAMFAVAGTGMAISSQFPWPDPRHLAIQAALGVQLAPPALAWGLRRVEGVGRLRAFLFGVFALMLLLTFVNSGWMWPVGSRDILKPLVNDGNVGWWERVYMVVLVGWASIAALLLERRLARA